jgi:hypothetical protein
MFERSAHRFLIAFLRRNRFSKNQETPMRVASIAVSIGVARHHNPGHIQQTISSPALF